MNKLGHANDLYDGLRLLSLGNASGAGAGGSVSLGPGTVTPDMLVNASAQYKYLVSGGSPFAYIESPGALNIAAGKTLVVSNSITVTAGADGQSYAFPAAGGTVALLNAANSFTLINPLTTIAEAWIGPSTLAGIYFKGSNVGIGTITPRKLTDFLSTSQAQLRLTYTDNSVFADFTVGSGGNLTVAPTGDFIFDPVGNDILPATGYDLNIGSLAKKFLTLHAAELWVETLVAQNTIATIGGRIVVGPTTYLTADISAGDTTIYVKHNEMASGDRVYLEANGAVEFMAITSAPSGAGPYSYTVTRSLDPSAASAWSAGDAVLNTGTTGDGFIDIYSFHSIKSATQYGPTIVGNIRNSATYNDWTEHWAIGNLEGVYGYGATTYGVAFGKYVASVPHVTIDATNGYRVFEGLSVVVGQWDAAGTFTLGTNVGAVATTKFRISNIATGTYNGETNAVGDVYIGDPTVASNLGNIKITAAGQIQIRRGTTNYITLDATDAQFTNKIKMLGASSAIAIGVAATLPSSATVGTGIWIDRTGLYGLNANVQQAYINATGQLMAGAGNVILDANGVYIMPMAAGGFYVDYYGLNFGLPGSVFSAITGVVDGLNDASNLSIQVNNIAGTKKLDFAAVYDSVASPTSYFNFSFLGTSAFYISATKAIVAGGLNVGTATTNTDMTLGLTINQGAADDQILAFKSSDVAHGMTTQVETDTYAEFAKQAATTGGLVVTGYSEATTGMNVRGFNTTEDATHSAAGVAGIMLRSSLKTGTTIGAHGANANLLVVRNDTSTKFLVDAEGDIHMDATSNINAWDEYDDIALLTAYRGITTRARDIFGEWVQEHAEVLAKTGVITFNQDGHHFVSRKGLDGLLIDAVRQMARRVEVLERRLNNAN